MGFFLAHQQRPGGSLQNSQSSVGNRTREPNDSTSQQLETDCGDVNDEATPCGCLHYAAKLAISQRTSLIPEQNLRRLKENFTNKTLASLIAKHLKGFFRRRIIEKSVYYRP